MVTMSCTNLGFHENDNLPDEDDVQYLRPLIRRERRAETAPAKVCAFKEQLLLNSIHDDMARSESIQDHSAVQNLAEVEVVTPSSSTDTNSAESCNTNDVRVIVARERLQSAQLEAAWRRAELVEEELWKMKQELEVERERSRGFSQSISQWIVQADTELEKEKEHRMAVEQELAAATERVSELEKQLVSEQERAGDAGNALLASALQVGELEAALMRLRVESSRKDAEFDMRKKRDEMRICELCRKLRQSSGTVLGEGSAHDEACDWNTQGNRPVVRGPDEKQRVMNQIGHMKSLLATRKVSTKPNSDSGSVTESIGSGSTTDRSSSGGMGSMSVATWLESHDNQQEREIGAQTNKDDEVDWPPSPRHHDFQLWDVPFSRRA
uniref:Uncharacterized protein n=1 Tax=Noctiluca scintillans TaxID=2966 RepID=A0A7S1AVB8_NOCSC|mmetsp:Transcript_61402/g.163336  ORF Transcript_61402/g.163336 Transcript_61402/m.163336 type:complete len:383 (+) Transcript_61402:71-1219(+)